MDIKKTRKINLILLLFLLTIFYPKSVRALADGDYMFIGERIPDIYIKEVADIGLRWVSYGDFLKRKSDNHWVYGIEPGMEISSSNFYEKIEENMAERAFISEDQWDNITLLAYYGYNYIDDIYDHTNINWYAVTQFLIWQALRPTWDIYFTNTLNGTRVPGKFYQEILELKNLVNNHYRMPSFSSNIFSIMLGDTLTIKDVNNLISDFDIKYNQNLNITKNNNELIIESKYPGNYEIELYKEYNRYQGNPILYLNDAYQDTISVGNLKKNSIKINVIVQSGKITIKKLEENLSSEESINICLLENSIYRIYTEDNILIDEIITDCEGLASSDILPAYGKYYLLEYKASQGYQLDLEKHYFEIDENNLDYKFNIYTKKEQEKNIADDNNINNYTIFDNSDENTEIIYIKIPVTGINIIKPINKNYVFIIPNSSLNEKKTRKKN